MRRLHGTSVTASVALSHPVITGPTVQRAYLLSGKERSMKMFEKGSRKAHTGMGAQTNIQTHAYTTHARGHVCIHTQARARMDDYFRSLLVFSPSSPPPPPSFPMVHVSRNTCTLQHGNNVTYWAVHVGGGGGGGAD